MKAALLLSALLAVLVIAPGDTVRVAASGQGTRYHSIRCASIPDGGVLVWRASADSLGYSACRRCILARPSTRKAAPRQVAR